MPNQIKLRNEIQDYYYRGFFLAPDAMDSFLQKAADTQVGEIPESWNITRYPHVTTSFQSEAKCDMHDIGAQAHIKPIALYCSPEGIALKVALSDCESKTAQAEFQATQELRPPHVMIATAPGVAPKEMGAMIQKMDQHFDIHRTLLPQETNYISEAKKYMVMDVSDQRDIAVSYGGFHKDGPDILSRKEKEFDFQKEPGSRIVPLQPEKIRQEKELGDDERQIGSGRPDAPMHEGRDTQTQNGRVIYAGILLDEEQKHRLFRGIAQYREETGNHALEYPMDHMYITLAKGEAANDLDLSKIGQPVRMHVTGYANDGRNEGVSIRLRNPDPEIQALAEEREKEAPLHLTVTVAEDAVPSDSGYLEFTPVTETINLEGTYGGFALVRDMPMEVSEHKGAQVMTEERTSHDSVKERKTEQHVEQLRREEVMRRAEEERIRREEEESRRRLEELRRSQEQSREDAILMTGAVALASGAVLSDPSLRLPEVGALSPLQQMDGKTSGPALMEDKTYHAADYAMVDAVDIHLPKDESDKAVSQQVDQFKQIFKESHLQDKTGMEPER